MNRFTIRKIRKCSAQLELATLGTCPAYNCRELYFRLAVEAVPQGKSSDFLGLWKQVQVWLRLRLISLLAL